MTSTRGRSTSIYIPADLVDGVENSGLTLTEIMRRGLANTKHVHSCGCGTKWDEDSAVTENGPARPALQEERSALQEDTIRRIFQQEIGAVLGILRSGQNYPAVKSPSRELTWEELQEASEE